MIEEGTENRRGIVELLNKKCMTAFSFPIMSHCSLLHDRAILPQMMLNKFFQNKKRKR